MLASLNKVPFWVIAAGYVALWGLVGVLVRGFLRRSLRAIARERKTEWSEVVAASLPRPAGIAVFLLALAAGVRTLPLEQLHLTEAHKAIAVALAILVILSLMRVAFKAIDAFGRSNPALRSSAGIGKAVTWVIGAAIVAVLVSDALGISLAPALTALGVGSLAVALALQDTLSNFFSGVTILVGKPVRPGDFIRVDPSYEGFVESIGWRSTQVRTLSNNLVVIPNATFSKAIITNYSLPTPNVSASVRVDVSLDEDLGLGGGRAGGRGSPCPRHPRDRPGARAQRGAFPGIRGRRGGVQRLLPGPLVRRSGHRAACPPQADCGTVQEGRNRDGHPARRHPQA